MARRRHGPQDDPAEVTTPLPFETLTTGDDASKGEGTPVSPEIDVVTGEVLSADEAAYQQRVARERAAGMVAIDVTYAAHAEAIHEPLDRRSERGVVDAGAWRVPRRNQTRLEIDVADLGHLAAQDGNTQAVQELAVRVARHALGEPAATLMALLYVYANDAGRRPRVTITLSKVLDELGYQRDKRGIHYTDSRRAVSRALLALQVTRVGLSLDRQRRSLGIIAPLIAALEYDMPRQDAHMSAEDAFDRGLPDEIAVTINGVWYGLRDESGQPTGAYALVERARLLPTASTGGRRVTAAGALSAYLADMRAQSPRASISLERQALLAKAHITDRNRANSTRTLARALDRLVEQGTLRGYAPQPLPLHATDVITLILPDPVAEDTATVDYLR